MADTTASAHTRNRGHSVPGREAKEVFVEAFANDRGKGRVTRAAQKAYPNQKKSSASATGSRLLKDAKIQQAIKRRLERVEKMANITREQIEGMLAEQAMSSFCDVLDNSGELDWEEAKKRGKDHLIREVTVTDRHSKDGSSRRTITFKLPNNQKAAELLADMRGWKKEAAKNPLVIAVELYRAMRADGQYVDIPDDELAGYAAKRFKVGVPEIINSTIR